MKTDLKKENVQEKDIIELQGFRSSDVGVVFKENDELLVGFSNKVISLSCWNDDLIFIANNKDFDVVALKRFDVEAEKFCKPMNRYCAKSIADRYEERGLKSEFIKNVNGRKV